jgi:hypothetical protein
MNINRLKSLLSALLILVLPASFAMAQYKVEAEKPEIVKVLSPDLGGLSAKKDFRPKDWMEIEVKFKVEVPPADKKKIKFLDKVTVKWYIAVKNPEGKGFILLEKEVNHVNVPVGQDIYASVYLSPNSVMRLTGGDRINKADIKEAGGEILVNGQQPVKNSGFFSKDTQGKWWSSGKLSRYDKIPLLNKDETPFKILWYSRYAEIEAKR